MKYFFTKYTDNVYTYAYMSVKNKRFRKVVMFKPTGIPLPRIERDKEWQKIIDFLRVLKERKLITSWYGLEMGGDIPAAYFLNEKEKEVKAAITAFMKMA